MNESLDKFFKDKLADHAIAPGPEAWKKIERNLSKKNKAIIWWRAAAVFVLLGIGAIVLLNVTKPSDQKNLISFDPSTAKNSTTEKEITTKKVIDLPKKITNNVPHNLSTTEISYEKSEATDQEKKDSTSDATIVTNSESDILNSVTAEKTETVAITEKPIVIEFTLEDFIQPANDSSQLEDKSGGLKRVLTVAREIKNGDRTLGLREAKNELFAFNLKKEKVNEGKQLH